MTGHSHYEAYAAECASAMGWRRRKHWFHAIQVRAARGASRQWNIPWTVQVSPGLAHQSPRGALQGKSHTRVGRRPLLESLQTPLATCLVCRSRHGDARKHQYLFRQRIQPLGADLLWSGSHDVSKFMQSHDRGNPYTPLLIILDHLAGYAPFHERTQGVLERTQGSCRNLQFVGEAALFQLAAPAPAPTFATNPEASYSHPTPYGEIADVMLNTVAGAATMARYPSILLAGEMRFSSFFIRELEKALLSGSECWIHPRHAESLGEDRIHSWQKPAGCM